MTGFLVTVGLDYADAWPQFRVLPFVSVAEFFRSRRRRVGFFGGFGTQGRGRPGAPPGRTAGALFVESIGNFFFRGFHLSPWQPTNTTRRWRARGRPPPVVGCSICKLTGRDQRCGHQNMQIFTSPPPPPPPPPPMGCTGDADDGVSYSWPPPPPPMAVDVLSIAFGHVEV